MTDISKRRPKDLVIERARLSLMRRNTAEKPPRSEGAERKRLRGDA